jgi:hypothetical protein
MFTNVIPFRGRRKPARGAAAPAQAGAAPTPPDAARIALAACMTPPKPGERYHVAPIWRGDYVAGFSVWDAGRNGVTPRRVRTFMAADLGRHVAAGRADSLRIALNEEWQGFQARQAARSQGGS